MRKKAFCLSFIINFIKLLCTIVFCFTGSFAIYFMIYTPLIMLLATSIKISIRILIISLDLLLWICIIVLSVIGIIRKKPPKFLFIASIIVSCSDFLSALINSATELKWAAGIYFFVALVINLCCILSKSKQKQIGYT